MPTVVLLGTLDTKGLEYAFLRDRVREHGVDVLLVDAGIMGKPLAEPDIGREEVAAAAGADVDELAAAGDRGAAIETMARGAAEIVRRLHAEGRLDGIAGLGGSRRLGARHAGDARAARRRAEADGLDRGLGRHAALRGRDRRDDDLLGRRHLRHQPDLGADHGQRGRGDRRHGQGDRACGGRRPAADRRDDVRRHDAVRDACARAAGGARLRGARLPCDRDGRPVDGSARPRRLHRRRARRHDHRAGRRSGRRRALGRARPAGSGRASSACRRSSRSARSTWSTSGRARRSRRSSATGTSTCTTRP